MAKRVNQRDRRLRILDILLRWEGELSNGRLRDLLGIQVVRASRMLSEYRDTHPDRVLWDLPKKRYQRLATREKYGGTADDYLHLLFDEDVVPDWLVRLDTQISAVRSEVLALLRKAIEGGTSVKIVYASMTHPKGTERVIYPHGIALAGRRWHARAWCCLRQEYRDFVIGRILEISTAESENRPDHVDESWENFVDVRLVPHKDLTPDQTMVVKHELFEGTAARQISTRGCLVPYLIQEVRASVSESQKPPEYQIEVSNLDQLAQYLFRCECQYE